MMPDAGEKLKGDKAMSIQERVQEKKHLTMEEELISFLNEKEMFLKKDGTNYFIETFQGQRVSDPMPLEEVYQLADDYLQNYKPGEEAVPVFLDVDDHEEDRSDMTFAEVGDIVDRFREMTSANRRGVIDLLVRACTKMDQEEKTMALAK